MSEQLQTTLITIAVVLAAIVVVTLILLGTLYPSVLGMNTDSGCAHHVLLTARCYR